MEDDNDLDFDDPVAAAGVYDGDPDPDPRAEVVPDYQRDAEVDELVRQRIKAASEGRDPDGEEREQGFGSELSDEEFLRAAEFARAAREGDLADLATQKEFEDYFRKNLELMRAGIEDPQIKEQVLFGGMDVGAAIEAQQALREAPAPEDAEPEPTIFEAMSDDQFEAFLRARDNGERSLGGGVDDSTFRKSATRFLREAGEW